MSNVTVIEWEGHSVVTDVSHSKVEYVLTSVYKVPSFTSRTSTPSQKIIAKRHKMKNINLRRMRSIHKVYKADSDL
jgi:hypothetical protein